MLLALLLLPVLASARPGDGCEESSLLQSRRPGDTFVGLPKAVVANPFQVKQATVAHRAISSEPKASPAKQQQCALDVRHALPACMQYSPEWCWATVASQLAGFYDPTHYPEAGRLENLGTSDLNTEKQMANSCVGGECRIVGSVRAPNIMDACCTDDVAPTRHDVTCAPGASAKDIETAIEWSSQQKYQAVGPLSEDQLIEVLNQGHPLGYAVFWVDPASGWHLGGHIMVIGGCSGDGRYYVHDSLTNTSRAGLWQELKYDELLNRNPWNAMDMWPSVSTLNGKPVVDASNEEIKEWFASNGPVGQWALTFVLSTDVMNLGIETDY